MNKANGQESDFITDGFQRIDPKAVAARPPKIRWSTEFRAMPLRAQIAYLEKFGNTMNHAAAMLQEERDKLARLCLLKEQQLEKVTQDLAANNAMIQGEVARMNTQRQQYHANIQSLNQKIRALQRRVKELEGGDLD